MNEISLIVAFSAGMLSFLSPCVLPMIPAYVSYLTGESISGLESGKARHTVLYKSIGFVLGFSIIFIILGASVSSLSRMLASNQHVFRKVGGLLVILFGLHVSGLFKVNLFYREKRFLPENINTQGVGSLLLGMAFAAGWTPCVGPILSSILIYAGSMETVGTGILLLFFYSLGMGIPFILTALAIGSFTRYFKRLSRYLPVVSAVSGILMIIFGLLMFTNRLSALSGYLSFSPHFSTKLQFESRLKIMKRSIIIWSIAAILVLVAAYTMISYNSLSRQSPPSVDNGSGGSAAEGNAASESQAIDFILDDLDGNSVKLSDFRGKKVLLNFWATWCPPCRAEMPDIEKLYKEYGDKDLVILAVNIGEDRETVKDFVEQNGYSFKILLDTKNEVANKYVVSAIPTSYFIDADGSISNRYVGAMSFEQMKELAGF